MPPKKRKNRTKMLAAKQMKAIQSRLMVISLQVDRYVYSGRALAVTAARAHVDEIRQYEPLCRGDARFMQVIEKLCRCLRSIIAEQEHPPANPDGTQTPQHDSRCDSPVYSLPDEDRTAVTQLIADNEQHQLHNNNTGNEDISEEENFIDNTATNIDATCSDILNEGANNDPSDDPNDSQNEMETIYLCDDEVEDTLESRDGNVHRALSNLTLNDTETINKNNECSQSILTDFDAISANNIGISRQMVQDEIEKPEVFKKPPLKENTLNPITKTQQKEILVKYRSYNSKLTERNINLTQLNEENNVHQTLDSEKNSTEVSRNKKVQRKRDTTKVKPFPKNETVKETKKKTKKALKVQSENVKHTISQTAPVAITNGGPNKENITDNVRPCAKLLDDKQMDKELRAVYNRCVVEDLSWMESIRYVRETGREEVELGCWEDSFWENCALPTMFDDTDFALY